MKINFVQCNSSNYRSGRSDRVRFLVVHFTANNGDTAKNNADYFAKNKNLSASAHYFVDEGDTVYQSVRDSDTAWHCGADKYKHPNCRNGNSIGIELCSRKNAQGEYYFKEQTVENAVALIKYLMQRYDVRPECVVRHYDVTGKNCPAPFVKDNEAWIKFKQKLEERVMFKDIKETDYAYKHIKKLFDYGIANGDLEGKFNPDQPLTRRDAAILIANALSVLGK